MEFVDFFVGKNDEGRRIDKIIRKMSPSSTMSDLYSYLRKGLIRVNSKKIKEDYKIVESDKIEIAKFLIEERIFILNEVLNNEICAEKNSTLKNLKENCAKKNSADENFSKKDLESKIDVVFENDFIKVINKPYDVNVHGSGGLSEIIESLYKKNHIDNSLSFKPGPLHRLDKKTTGLLVFSNNLQGAKVFTKMIAEKNVRKFYIGISSGKIGKIFQKEVWTDFIEENSQNLQNSKESKNFQNNKNKNFYTMKIIKDKNQQIEKNKAITICTPLAYGSYKNQQITLCQFEIKTGKKHQIRLQSATHNAGLFGDTAYGAKKIEKSNKIHQTQDFYLHAYKLIFPSENQIETPAELTAPLSKNFIDFLNESLINWDSSLIIE